MKAPLRRLLALILPLFGLAGAWIWTHARAQHGSEWDVPVTANGPLASLRGRYVSYRYEWGLPEEGDAWTSAALCLEGAPPTLAAVRASDPADKTCRVKALAIDGGSRHEGIQGGVLYVPQEQVPAIRRQLGDPALQPMVRIRVNDGGAITPLSIGFRRKPSDESSSPPQPRPSPPSFGD